MQRILCVVFTLILSLGFAAGVPQRAGDRLVPPALQAFEHLVGAWRVHGFLETNKQDGWDEPATWGWRFEKGKIVGMEVEFKDGRYFTAAKLEPLELGSYESPYRLTATTAGEKEKEVVYEGTLKFGKNISFTRQKGDAAAPDQISLQLLHDVRYVMFVESKKGTAVKKLATIGATRADVRFGAAGKEEQGPKCVITGAPGTSTVSHAGQTYYVCCSGCRAEFEHDPEKWIKLFKEGKLKTGTVKPAGDAEKGKPKESDATKPADADSSKPKTEKKESKDAPSKDAAKPKDADSESKSAANLLARGKLLEKNGKRDEAIKVYERLLKEHPKTSEAEAGEERLKALRPSNEST